MSNQSSDAGRALASILCTIIIPTVILSKYSGESSLGVRNGVLAAFSFPLGYGIYEYAKTRKIDFMAVLGLLNVILTGGLALLGSDWKWIALKEACFSLLLAVFVVLSHHMGRSFVKPLFLNPAMINTASVERKIEERNLEAPFEKLLGKCSRLLAAAFLVSSVLNYLIAWWLLNDKKPNSETFNAALGTMNWTGFLVIGVPLTAALMLILFKVFYPSLARMLGMETADLLNPGETVRRTVKAPADTEDRDSGS